MDIYSRVIENFNYKPCMIHFPNSYDVYNSDYDLETCEFQDDFILIKHLEFNKSLFEKITNKVSAIYVVFNENCFFFNISKTEFKRNIDNVEIEKFNFYLRASVHKKQIIGEHLLIVNDKNAIDSLDPTQFSSTNGGSMKLEILFRCDQEDYYCQDYLFVEIKEWSELPEILEDVESRNTVISITVCDDLDKRFNRQ